MRCHLLALPLCALLSTLACEPAAECRVDADCSSDEHCSTAGTCVGCLDSGDCAAGSVCCRGSCAAVEVEGACGCEAAPNGDNGTACVDKLCLVGDARATAANIADGVCSCPCDPGTGGTVCTIDDVAENGFTCGCDREDPVGTCEAPSVDVNGIFHRPADTCSPDETCVCFAGGGTCGAAEDCTSAGCVDLVSDVTNCGVAERTCTDPTTGVVDGVCNNGGCACDVPTDCQGEGLNVDSCAFGDGDSLRCLCDGYTIDGVDAPCPLSLACVEGGCRFDGAVYATNIALAAALQVRLP
jgi:hypothetical protein